MSLSDTWGADAGSELPLKAQVSSFRRAQPTVGGHTRIELGLGLFKIGRSTGFTVGFFNGVQQTALCSRTRDEKENWKPVVSRAYCVVPNLWISPTFGNGDSGSVVLDREGKFAGIFIGGGSDTHVGYFTGAEDVIDDIKRVTGATNVSLEV
ncbi:hypothetical protein FQN54_006604 [Arachnomyces sp. PD_36]|nr:hypothetical protein FQN54_006604 [Arachnomyces sp. PD_36]